MTSSRPPTVRAPAFPPGLAWLNTPYPLRLDALRGKFVLLDFWTFCCINCMHVLPELKRLEQKYPDTLVVIGVHSAKFSHERETDNIRNALLRYEIEHPVVNDRDFQIWQQYAVRSWPTLCLIDPNGYIVAQKSGEGVYAPFHQALQRLLPVYEKAGSLDRTPLDLFLERDHAPERMLSFPGKIAGDAASDRLFLADTNHHRLLVLNTEGHLLMQIGQGLPGLADGPLETATFRHPQGLWFDAETETLYVADTENHALRRVDLGQHQVTTIAGNGHQARHESLQADGQASALNSPWDVLLHEGHLYVAMAGPHQLWVFDPDTGWGEIYAGNGWENIVDGPRRQAQLAQPSGLASDGTYLYFADSETSALRRVPYGGEEAPVETLVGEGLFAFGDVDGSYPNARLQHPLGLAYADGVVYLADSYNHKIKRYSLAERTVLTFLGEGEAGYKDGIGTEARFDEPGGLVALGDQLYIADTNNHQLRVADLKTGTVRTLAVAEYLDLGAERTPQQVIPIQAVAPGEGLLRLHITLPDGYVPNDLNRGCLTVEAQDAAVACPASEQPWAIAYPLSIPFIFARGETDVCVEGTVYYCDKANGRCLLAPVSMRIPVAVQPGADASEATARLVVAPPDVN